MTHSVRVIDAAELTTFTVDPDGAQALQSGHGDESLRLVYPLERYKLELGEADWSGAQRFIRTLETTGGFAVSFAGSADCLACMARSIFGDNRLRAEADSPSRQLS